MNNVVLSELPQAVAQARGYGDNTFAYTKKLSF